MQTVLLFPDVGVTVMAPGVVEYPNKLNAIEDKAVKFKLLELGTVLVKESPDVMGDCTRIFIAEQELTGQIIQPLVQVVELLQL